MPELAISTRNADGVTILDLAGGIALGDSSAKLHSALRSNVDEGNNLLLLNLADVTTIDSSGLGSLIAGFATVEKSGGKMKLENLSEKALELMTITKLLTVFDVFDNETDAIASFGSEERAKSA